MDASQREGIRQRYAYSCGYCGVHESDVGATLTVDHHHPTVYGGANDDENLIYCCHRCNEHKGAYWHKVQIPHIRLLHPLEDDLTSHQLTEETICKAIDNLLAEEEFTSVFSKNEESIIISSKEGDKLFKRFSESL